MIRSPLRGDRVVIQHGPHAGKTGTVLLVRRYDSYLSIEVKLDTGEVVSMRASQMSRSESGAKR